MTSFNQSPEVLPPEEWFQNLPSGDIALCDPFTGEQFKKYASQDAYLPGDVIPPVFAEDEEASVGYAHLRAARFRTEGDIAFNVWLMDPSMEPTEENIDGLQTKLERLMDDNYIVGYSTFRSVYRSERERRSAPEVGGLVLPGMAQDENPYLQAIRRASDNTEVPIFTFDPSRDVFGEPDSNASRNLKKIEDVVRAEAETHQDMEQTPGAFTGMDLVYTNMLAWAELPELGKEVDRLATEFGAFPDKTALLIPAETGALYDHLGGVLGVPGSKAPIDQRIGAQNDYLAYPHMINAGRIRTLYMD